MIEKIFLGAPSGDDGSARVGDTRRYRHHLTEILQTDARAQGADE